MVDLHASMRTAILLITISACASLADALASRHVLAARAPVKGWDLEKAMRDEPVGAYRKLLDPIVYASQLTYATTYGTSQWERFQGSVWRGSWGDDFGANSESAGLLSGDGNWSRLLQVEQDPTEGGAHSRVLVDWESKRTIIAFRGACTDKQYPTCRSDLCVVTTLRYKSVRDAGRPGPDNCPASGNFRTYMEMAADTVRQARRLLGDDFAILVTGHSLGGAIALSLAAVGVLDVQVVALEPTPYGRAMRQQLGFSDDQLRALNPSDRYALYDPYDLMDTSFAPLEELRPSTTLCMYVGTSLPTVCQNCIDSIAAALKQIGLSAMVNNSQSLASCLSGFAPSGTATDEYPYPNQCKHDSHALDRYVDLYLPEPGGTGTPFLPVCHAVTI